MKPFNKIRTATHKYKEKYINITNTMKTEAPE